MIRLIDRRRRLRSFRVGIKWWSGGPLTTETEYCGKWFLIGPTANLMMCRWLIVVVQCRRVEMAENSEGQESSGGDTVLKASYSRWFLILLVSVVDEIQRHSWFPVATPISVTPNPIKRSICRWLISLTTKREKRTRNRVFVFLTSASTSHQSTPEFYGHL